MKYLLKHVSTNMVKLLMIYVIFVCFGVIMVASLACTYCYFNDEKHRTPTKQSDKTVDKILDSYYNSNLIREE